MLPDANLRHQEALDCAKGQKAEAEFPFCPRSFDRARCHGRGLRLGAAALAAWQLPILRVIRYGSEG